MGASKRGIRTDRGTQTAVAVAVIAPHVRRPHDEDEDEDDEDRTRAVGRTRSHSRPNDPARERQHRRGRTRTSTMASAYKQLLDANVGPSFGQASVRFVAQSLEELGQSARQATIDWSAYSRCAADAAAVTGAVATAARGWCLCRSVVVVAAAVVVPIHCCCCCYCHCRAARDLTRKAGVV